MTTIRERFNKTKAAFSVTNKMLADESGLSTQTVINQCGGKYNISVELIAALVRLAPSADVRWIITGDDESRRLDDLENEVFRIRKIIESLQKG